VPRTWSGMSDHLDVAAAIGVELCREAIWHEGRCAWLGALTDGDARARGRLARGSLDAGLYAGTAGVGLFLAELAAACADREVARTARGALRHAKARVRDVDPRLGLSVYDGTLGVAIALLRSGDVLDDQELVEAGEALAADACASPSPPGRDLLHGAAGAVLGLLALDARLEEPSRAPRARALAAALLDADLPLTGLAHGRSGLGLALVAADGARLRRKGLRVLADEGAEYVEADDGWPDLRDPDGAVAAGAPPPFATAWCHGAPGIALARIRALELVPGDPALEGDARRALRASEWPTAAAAEGIGADFCLCHGLAGNAWVLLEGSEALRDERLARTAHGVGDAGVETYHRHGLPWPCGPGQAPPPGLLVGMAGIGLFYMRLAGTPVASPLLPERLVAR
jgi:lantibiotic biosynthesis protein